MNEFIPAGNQVSSGKATGVTLAYTTAGHVNAASSMGISVYTYEANGNMRTREVDGVTYTLTFDAENRLVSYTGGSITAAFVYDGDGKRVKGTVNGVETVYIGNYYEEVEEDSVTTTRKYYFAGAQRIAMRENNTILYFFLADHLGSTAITLNAAGVRTAELRYSAWGETRYQTGATPTNARYTGQMAEPALGSDPALGGLYYYGARWYDSALGRFVSPDSIIPGAGDPQAWDRFAYTRNNPVNRVDPSGHDDTCPENGCTDNPSTGPSDSSDPLVSYSDEWGFCILNGCTGGESYWKWWREDYLSILESNLEETASSIANTADGVVSPSIESYEYMTGNKITPRIGYGLDIIIQGAKDWKRDDLNLYQRGGRLVVAAVEGAATSEFSKGVGIITLLGAKEPAALALGAGQPEVSGAILGGAYAVGYLSGTFAGSVLFDRFNPQIYQFFSLDTP